MLKDLSSLTETVRDVPVATRSGQITGVSTGSVEAKGLSQHARMGDLVEIEGKDGQTTNGEIVAMTENTVVIMTHSPDVAMAIGDRVRLDRNRDIRPDMAWTGRVIDALGQPMDRRPLLPGQHPIKLLGAPPDATARHVLGERLHTSLGATDTFLPLAKGQRVGIFAGSGVGKTSLLGLLATGIDADVVVIGLIGERGRELREFIENVMGEAGMARTVIVAATSDQSPLLKRRAAWTATGIAEMFRDQGKHVLLIVDSITRFAEAHREIALTAGEPPSLRAYPPSTASVIAALTERAGPGTVGGGYITAIYSVLVAGSDMEEPVSDIVRGVLDGHIILDREIAERGRFPAIDIRRSVSRSLPGAATGDENALLAEARKLIAAYESAETMIQTGLYVPGSDPEIDAAIKVWPLLDEFVSTKNTQNVAESFENLRKCLMAAQSA